MSKELYLETKLPTPHTRRGSSRQRWDVQKPLAFPLLLAKEPPATPGPTQLHMTSDTARDGKRPFPCRRLSMLALSVIPLPSVLLSFSRPAASGARTIVSTATLAATVRRLSVMDKTKTLASLVSPPALAMAAR
jgi:hypothetical protein